MQFCRSDGLQHIVLLSLSNLVHTITLNGAARFEHTALLTAAIALSFKRHLT